jgi:hypothetical protein
LYTRLHNKYLLMQVNIIYNSQLFSFLQNKELLCHIPTKKKMCVIVIGIE